MKTRDRARIDTLAAAICSECGRAEGHWLPDPVRHALETIRRQAAEIQEVIAKVTDQEVNKR